MLVPGLAGGFDLLGPLARLLARDFQVISYQLRGEDDYFALRRRFDLPDLVEDLSEFLDWFGLERPAVMGVSFGGVSFDGGLCVWRFCDSSRCSSIACSSASRQ